MEKSEIEKLYEKLLKATIIEYTYIKEIEEIEPKKLNRIIMQKKVERDRIEKYEKKNNIDDEKLKAVLTDIIREIIEIENKNKDIYNNKLKLSKNEIIKLSKEKQLKQAYYTKKVKKNSFDEKK